MGCNISGILAILFMDRLETIALSSHLSISHYKRYVDDIYLQTTGEEMADQFHYTMNNLHPKLKFEIEKPEITPNGFSLSLLDFNVTISKDGKSSFEFYKKTAKKPLFVHHQSAIPEKSKINFIRNERKRIDDKCFTKATATKHQNMFDDILRLNGYPEGTITKTKHSQNHQKDPRPLNTEWSYLKMPYVSERLNYKVANIFRKEGYQCGSRTSHTPSDEPSLRTTRNGHARGPTVLSPTPICAYYATLFTKSPATTVINTISEARHALSMTE